MGPFQRVWVTGAGGLIGHEVVQSAALYAPDIQVQGTTRTDVDLTNTAAVQETFTRLQPQIIIHCAALTKTGLCEQHPSLAWSLNVEATARLADVAHNIPFIFFSTDLVFDGRQGHYDEMAPANPLSVYARTKVEAERRVLANPGHTVIRTSLNGGTSPTGDRGFNEEMRRAWQDGRMLKLFTDELRCPIPAAVTARAVWELILSNAIGLYHVAGAERLSRWQIGSLLASRWPQLNPRVEAASRIDFPGPPRPADTSLNCAKAQKLLSFPLPGLTEWLDAHPDEVF
ncbi:MAG TPA: SDR family oxidoreductase [Nitrospiraceae bacterium]|nr:SDR family oxidoreductase [Nitrospiraceae bacterium]